MDWFPVTMRGISMREEGVSEATIREYEQYKLAMDGLRGEAELRARHPDAADPAVQRRVSDAMARDPLRFIRISEGGGPGVAFEAAYMESAPAPQEPSAPHAAPSGAMGGDVTYNGGMSILAEQYQHRGDMRNVGQRVLEDSGSWNHAAKAVGLRIHHPDLDVDLRR
jgi:hypothetical protein